MNATAPVTVTVNSLEVTLDHTELRMIALMRDRASDRTICHELRLSHEVVLRMANRVREILAVGLTETLPQAAKRLGVVLPKRWI